MDKKENKIGLIEMIVAMVLMGTVGIFVVESGQNSFNVVFFRCVFGTMFLAAYCYFRGFLKNTGITRNILMLTILSGIFLVFNWVLLFSSFETSSISIATTIYHTQPFFFLIIGSIVFHERITADKILWIMIAFIGVVLVANIDAESLSISSEQLWGVIYALAAAMLWAITAVIVKRLTTIKPHLVALIQVIIGIFVLYPFTTMGEVANVNSIQWGYLIALGGIHTCLTYILMYSAFQKLNTAIISVLTFIYPAVAILADYVVYDELLTILQTIGVVLILFSSYATSRDISVFARFKKKM